MNDYITVNEVAQMLHMHPETVRSKAARKEIPGSKIFGQWLFKESRIIRMVEDARQ